MNPKLLLLTCLVFSHPLLANPDPEDAPPPAAEPAQPVEEAAKDKAPGWLGVSANPAGQELMLHLGLDHGVLLETVVPDSPAAKAGLADHDIITAVGDREIATMEDLREAIQEHNAGDEVEFKVIQKGRRVNKMIELAGARAAQLGAGINILPMGPDGNGARQLRFNLQNLQLQGGGQLQLGVEAGGGSIKMNDADGSVELKTRKDAREVIVRDRKGEIEYEGPWDTPQDKAAVPPEMRKRIEAVSEMFGGADQPFHMEIVPVPEPGDPEEPEEDE